MKNIGETLLEVFLYVLCLLFTMIALSMACVVILGGVIIRVVIGMVTGEEVSECFSDIYETINHTFDYWRGEGR